MDLKELRCVNCDKTYPIGIYYYCNRCGFPLEVVYEETGFPVNFIRLGEKGIWVYQDLLPVKDKKNQISLGEGQTPLLISKYLGQEINLSNVYFKCEGVNPTGSFKDRPTSVGLSMALSLGASTVVASSTGNAGASLAAYAARAQMRALVFVTKDTPPSKLQQIHFHGAKIIPVRGSLSDAYNLALKASREWDWMNLTSTFVSPYTPEGDKTVSYELYQDLERVPDYIIVPVSVGPLAVGIYKGFKELKKMGLVDKLPRMVAAQSEKCAPIVKAFEKDLENVRAWEGGTKTVAGGIADPLWGYENDATYALRIIRESNGFAVSASDTQIINATKCLAEKEGIFSEPTGAVSVAVLKKLKRIAGIRHDETVVCLITGHGLKQNTNYGEQFELPSAIDPSLKELDKFLSEYT